MPPFTKRSAKRHTRKANTPKKQRQWSHVAESAMARGADEGSAIRQANAVVARNSGRRKKGVSTMARRKRGRGKKHSKKR